MRYVKILCKLLASVKGSSYGLNNNYILSIDPLMKSSNTEGYLIIILIIIVVALIDYTLIKNK